MSRSRSTRSSSPYVVPVMLRPSRRQIESRVNGNFLIVVEPEVRAATSGLARLTLQSSISTSTVTELSLIQRVQPSWQPLPPKYRPPVYKFTKVRPCVDFTEALIEAGDEQTPTTFGFSHSELELQGFLGQEAEPKKWLIDEKRDDYRDLALGGIVSHLKRSLLLMGADEVVVESHAA